MRLRRRGYSLVELMVTIAIVGVLASVASSGFVQYKTRARSSDAILKLNSLAKGIKAYHARGYSEKGLGAENSGGCFPENDDTPFDLTCGCTTFHPDGRCITPVCGDGMTDALGFDPQKLGYYTYVVAAADVLVIANPCYDQPIYPALASIAYGDANQNGLIGQLHIRYGLNADGAVYSSGLIYNPLGGDRTEF